MSALLRRISLNACLIGISGLAALFLVELALMLMGFPIERGIQVTHPPNFRDVRTHLEYEYEFSTNRVGLRNRDISSEKPLDTARILLAGDSFVEGIGMDGDATISAYLERDLSAGRSVEVINGGLQATGPFEHGRLVRQVGYGLDLDGVVFFVFDNDVSDVRLWQRAEDMASTDPGDRTGLKGAVHYLLPRTYTAASVAWARAGAVLEGMDVIERIVLEARERGVASERIEQWQASVLPAYGEAIRNGTIAPQIFSLSLVSPGYWSGPIDLDTPDIREKFAKMTELLTSNVADATARGIEVAVVYIPSKFQFEPAAHSSEEPWVLAGADIEGRWLSEKTAIRRQLEEWAAAGGIRFLDMTPHYREATGRGEQLTWQLDEHLNARGNEFTASVLADWLGGPDGFVFLD